MIEWIRAYIKTIAAFLIISIIIKTAATGKSGKYINFVCRAALILIICVPVMNIFSAEKTDIESVISEALNEYNHNEGELEAYENNPVLKNVFLQNLKGNIKADVSAFGFETNGIDVYLKNEDDVLQGIESIEISVRGEADVSEAAEYLKEKYGAENIKIYS